MRRLPVHGITLRHVRNAALLDLAAHTPAPVLADLLGIHITSAINWTNAAAGAWHRYAAARAHTSQPRP